MKRIINGMAVVLMASFVFYGCSEDIQSNEISQENLDQMTALGFNVDDIYPRKVDGGFVVEGDIFLSHEDLNTLGTPMRIPNVEHYATTNMVNAGGGRNITVYIPVASDGGGDDGGGGNGNGKPKKNKNEFDARGGKGKPGGGGGTTFSATYEAALDEAIARYNGENLNITFSRVSTSSGADIVFSRLSSNEESQGILGSAGFPTGGGDPYGAIQMSGILESTYGLSVNGIATIMAHEMGHCIGFRHTDYMDRSYSCGGSAYNEGSAGVGANHIPGTPTGPSANSYMLACTDGSNRNFTNADKTALNYLY